MAEVCKVEEVAEMLDAYAEKYPQIQHYICGLKCDLRDKCPSYLASRMLIAQKAKDIIEED